MDDRESVDSACRSLTASWVREKVKEKNFPPSNGTSAQKMMMQQKSALPDIEDLGELCSFYEGFIEKSETF
jgi:hypothetical protein